MERISKQQRQKDEEELRELYQRTKPQNESLLLAPTYRPRYRPEETVEIVSKNRKRPSSGCWRCLEYVCCVGSVKRKCMFLLLFCLLSFGFLIRSHPTTMMNYYDYSTQYLYSKISASQQNDVIQHQSYGLFGIHDVSWKDWLQLKAQFQNDQKVTCPHLTSLEQDWVLCGLPSEQPSCLVYSSHVVTADDQWKLESQLLTTTQCEIHVFDPNGTQNTTTTKDHGNIYFHDWGWWNGHADTAVVNDNAKFQTIKETVQTLKHHHKYVHVLYLDCETCEWDIYPDLLSENDITFLQIILHVHDTSNHDLQDFFQTLHQHHYVNYYQKTIHADETIYGFLKFHPDFFHS